MAISSIPVPVQSARPPPALFFGTMASSLPLPSPHLLPVATRSPRANCGWGGFVSSGSRTRTSAVVRESGEKTEDHPLVDESSDVPMVVDKRPKLPERDFSGTAYVPVYVMLPLGVINMQCELVDEDDLVNQLRVLKSANVDGIMVDCWWGIVEACGPQQYNWSGYKRLFQIVRDLKLKLQVVMSFHECGGNVGDDVHIPLPQWISEIGQRNPDIFFTDREGRRNPECLTWGIDKERVLRARTAVEVYFDYMRSFRVEFDEFFEDGIITEIEIGLGPCGELRYPSYPAKFGWKYPGIGEFQCYDRYLLKSLKKAAEVRGHSFWGKGPDNAESYNSRPHETRFFCDGGDYDGYYGRFFLNCEILQEYGSKMTELSKGIVKIVLKCLGDDFKKKFYESEFKNCHGYLRINNYSSPESLQEQEQKEQEQEKKEQEAEGLGMHTDMSCVTIVYQDEIGGLQVRSKEGKWLDLIPCEGTLVVNIGDMLQAWSNEKFRSSEHRVVLKQPTNRFSLAFFWCFDDEKVILAPDEVVGEGNERIYRSFVCLDYLKFRENDEKGKFEKVGFTVKDFAGVGVQN